MPAKSPPASTTARQWIGGTGRLSPSSMPLPRYGHPLYSIRIGPWHRTFGSRGSTFRWLSPSIPAQRDVPFRFNGGIITLLVWLATIAYLSWAVWLFVTRPLVVSTKTDWTLGNGAALLCCIPNS